MVGRDCDLVLALLLLLLRGNWSRWYSYTIIIVLGYTASINLLAVRQSVSYEHEMTSHQSINADLPNTSGCRISSLNSPLNYRNFTISTNTPYNTKGTKLKDSGYSHIMASSRQAGRINTLEVEILHATPLLPRHCWPAPQVYLLCCLIAGWAGRPCDSFAPRGRSERKVIYNS